MNMEILFAQFNRLYTRCFPLYRLIYFAYKRCSDRDKIRLIKKYVATGMTVLDIGANIGFYTTLLSRLVGKNGIVYAFEPNGMNFFHLTQSTSRLHNVRTIRAACGEKNGTTYLYESPSMNVDHQVYDNGESRHKIEVVMMSIDDFFKDKTTYPEFIKIDVQGYDCFVLKGMSQTLKNSPKVLLIGELWPYGLKKAGSSATDYINLVKQEDFGIWICGENDINEIEQYKDNKFFYIDFFAKKEA